MRKFIKAAVSFVFVLGFAFCNAQSIMYEPYGPMDKPLPTIEIKIKDSDSLIDFYRINHRNIYVQFIDKKDFRKLIKYVKQKDTDVKYILKHNYSYGTYKVTYTDGGNSFEYMIMPHEESGRFFAEQLYLVTSNRYLYEELQLLIQRL